MPSKSKKQADFMRAVAHGWKPTRSKGPPVSVAKEFVAADKKAGKYKRGGISMRGDRAGLGELKEGGLAAVGMQEGGAWTPWGPATTQSIPKKHQEFMDQDFTGKSRFAKMFRDVQNQMREKYYGRAGFDPSTTVATGPREDTGYDPYYGRGLGSFPDGRRRGPGGRGGRRNGGGGGPPGRRPPPGNEVPPDRVVPTRPPIDYTPPDPRAGRDTPLSEQLRLHRQRVAQSLTVPPGGYAGGGTVKGYQEGGTARADNPYDPVRQKYQWRAWERKHGRDPDVADAPPPPPPPAEEPEELSWLDRLRGVERGRQTRTERELEELGENARGGYQNYQRGGLAALRQAAMRPPAGGVPPTMGGAPPRGGVPRRAMPPTGMNVPRKSTPLRLPPGFDPRRSGPKLGPPPGVPDDYVGPVGGARVPPNLRGMMQRRMMENRPRRAIPGPAGAGGARNRVGQMDQQGGLARALQRGTGRPPMSRRQGFYR